MPPQKRIYHAVRRGWNGSKVYELLEDAQTAISGLPKASLRSFKQKWRADKWVLENPERRSEGTEASAEAHVLSPAELIQAYKYFQQKSFLRHDVTLDEVLGSTSAHDSLPQPGDAVGHESTQVGSAGLDSIPTPDPTPSPSIVQPIPAGDQDISLGPTQPVQSPVVLASEQQCVLDHVKTRRSVFITGSAGTGKSLLLREVIKWCTDNKIRLAITASTGAAAVSLGGSTLHSFAGVGLGKEDVDTLVDKILGKRNHDKWKRQQGYLQRESSPDDSSDEEPGSNKPLWPRLVKKWKQTDLLIIDEISMVDGVFFDKLEYIARCLRKNDKPFGGIQLVICGDFCQLPPVSDHDDEVPVPSTFAFEAKSWDKCLGPPMVLEKVFRQKDQEFVGLLNALRFGHVTPEVVATIARLQRRVEYTDGLEPTELYPTRLEVDMSNCWKLKRIKQESHTYQAKDTAGCDRNGRPIPEDKMNRLLRRVTAPQSLELKEGAQVMLIKNIVQGSLVNGTIGKVVGFMTTREAADRNYSIGIPPNEADAAQDQAKHWRKRSRPSTYDLTGGLPGMFRKDDCRYPLVHFPTADAHLLCVPQTFDVNDCRGSMEASRAQVPLILAWALSIHKSQGQTLPRVRVDLGESFEKGQVYVALSRAVSLDTLEVVSFDSSKVMIDQRVMRWAQTNMPQAIPPELRFTRPVVGS